MELEAEYVIQYIDMLKQKKKYMKNYDKKTTSSYYMYLDANNLYG